MRVIVASLVCASYLFANNINSVIEDVSKLRQKYDECVRQNEALLLPSAKDDNYNKEINRLKEMIKTRVNTIDSLEAENKTIKKELTQKQGVITSLERSLTAKDEQLRKALADSQQYKKSSHNETISKAEREQLRKALLEAKSEKEKLEKSMGKNSKDVIALEGELKGAKSEIDRLKKEIASLKQAPKATPATSVVEKIVYKDNPKTLEYDKLIKSLQSELTTAEITIKNLRSSQSSTKEPVEKIVYVDKPIEKIIYRDKPVEKIVEKVVYKNSDNSRLKELEQELKVAKLTISRLENIKKSPEKIVEKVVYKDKIIEKVVYRDKPEQAQASIAPKQAIIKTPPQTAPKPAVVSNNIVSSKPTAVATTTKPSAYRMAKDAPIYSAPNGSVVDSWEERRSFTSGTSTTGWVKITGYFVDRVWQRADEELWVKESDVIKRD